jgi:hypothetical protein
MLSVWVCYHGEIVDKKGERQVILVRVFHYYTSLDI